MADLHKIDYCGINFFKYTLHTNLSQMNWVGSEQWLLTVKVCYLG